MLNVPASSLCVALRTILLLFGLASFVAAVPTPQSASPPTTSASSSGYWLANIQRQGAVAFGGNSSYQIFRNVQDFGAKGMCLTPFILRNVPKANISL